MGPGVRAEAEGQNKSYATPYLNVSSEDFSVFDLRISDFLLAAQVANFDVPKPDLAFMILQ